MSATTGSLECIGRTPAPERDIETDRALEFEIRAHHARLLAAENTSERRSAWAAMAAAIKRRSPEQIAKMEREQGLARTSVGIPRVR